MNKLIPLSKFSRLSDKLSFLSKTSVVVDEKGIPMGFFFGRESFISLLSKIDEQFEQKVASPKEAYNNFAGRLIDLIEEKLPVREEFIKGLKKSIETAENQGWIPLSELKKSLNV